ncbi:MAG: hypothetical protein EA422_02330 [Gemmatimonadales bacterium]|nr:MAG: hypothetical protein EA422_02330 [Gemmatimonadales bacterium]
MFLRFTLLVALPALLILNPFPGPALAAQDHDHRAHDPEPSADEMDPGHHEMWMIHPGGWHLMGMAHVFPVATAGAPFRSESPLNGTGVYFPHAAAMFNLESPSSRFVFRFMPNFEGLTLEGGEPTFGGWGEGFIDRRHPHTFLHEAMLSWNVYDVAGGALSLSAGRGFAPFGTDDPMYRPTIKYPTNHHLSQVLERWTANAVFLHDGGWSVEVGVFDGDEPEDAWDLGNYRNFGNSWSGRVAHRWGPGDGMFRSWEASASFARIRENHGGHGGPGHGDHGHGDHGNGHADHGGEERTDLANVALRHDAVTRAGRFYALAEFSRSWPEDGSGYRSALAEVQLTRGGHQPFVRIESATRPEYDRRAGDGSGFFRYEHGEGARAASRWFITSVGYGHLLTDLPLSLRPFVEAQHHRVAHERGPAEFTPDVLFGTRSFFSLSAGVRIYLGGGPMRMGRYGVLDPMTAAMRGGGHDHSITDDGHDDHHHHHHHHP